MRYDVSLMTMTENTLAYLDKGPNDGLGEPGGEPLLVLGNREVKVLEVDVHLLDGKEGLSVVLVGVLEGDIERDTVRAELEGKDTRVLERPEPDLAVDPEGDVLGFKVESLNTETEGGVILRGV